MQPGCLPAHIRQNSVWEETSLFSHQIVRREPFASVTQTSKKALILVCYALQKGLSQKIAKYTYFHFEYHNF